MAEILKAIVERDFMTAYKMKQEEVKNTLKLLKSAISTWEKANPGKETTDEVVVTIIGSEIKKRNQAIDAYSKSNDLVAQANMAKEQAELYILQKYMPQPLTDEEITNEIETVKATNPERLMPAVMQHFSKNFKGRYDARYVQSLIK